MRFAEQVAEAERSGWSSQEALQTFDALESPTVEFMIGRWRGQQLRTGHVLDNMLAAYSWYGKEFHSSEIVFPLLFGGVNGHPIALDPRYLPLNRLTARMQAWPAIRTSFQLLYPLLRTKTASARLRTLSFRNAAALAMIYDHQPIIDIFRLVDQNLVLGLMDCRSFDPLFFTLRRVTERQSLTIRGAITDVR